MGSRRRLVNWLATVAMLVASIPMGAAPAAAATEDLFLSEYIEGSSNNKALEISNGTGAAVDLAGGGYNVQMFFNGSATAGLTINLTGTVADGDVFVLAQSSANAAILAQADQTNGSGWFNGDDAVVLRKGTTVLDVVGQIGFDPGTEWGSGLTSTADNTLARVTGAAAYHINADEVPVLDYNTEFKSAGQIASLFAPDEFRTSDHDPIVLGFCDAVAPTASATADPSMLWPPNNQLVDVNVTLDVTDGSPVTVELVSVTKDEPDWNPRRGPDIVIVDDTTFQLRASRLGNGDGRVYTITYSAVDACGNETVFTTEVTVPHDQGN